MSYARFSRDSDVYVYESVGGGFVCDDCALHEKRTVLDTPAAMIVHLLEHRAAGHAVPDAALNGLLATADRGRRGR